MTAPPRTVTRPSVPPLAWFAVAMCVGSVAGEHASWEAYLTARWPLWVWLATPLAVSPAVERVRRRTPLCLALAGLAAGFVVSLASGASWLAAVRSVSGPGDCRWSGVVVKDAEPGDEGVRVTVRLDEARARGRSVRVRLAPGTPAPAMGARVAFGARIRPPQTDGPWGRVAARRGEVGSGRAWGYETRGWRAGPVGGVLEWRERTRRALGAVEGPGGDLLTGVLIGDRRRVAGTPLEEDFRLLGLSHVLAVSGDQLGLACAAVVWLLRRSRIARPAQAVLAVGAGWCFTVVTGLQVPTVRALIMVVAASAAVLAGRRADPLAALSAAVVVMVAADPWCVFDLGFRLSVVAVGSLVLLGGLVQAWAGATAPPAAAGVATVVGCTLLAQLASLPISAPAFGMVSLAAPLANVVVLPLVPLALCLAAPSALLCGIEPVVGGGGLAVAGRVLDAAASLASALGRMPSAAVPVDVAPVAACIGVSVSLAVSWAVWPLPTRRSARIAAGALCLGTLLCGLGPPGIRGPAIVVMDVGQGDAVLVRDGDHALLVDCGPDETPLRKALARQGVRRLDGIVLTHPHDDHTGGVGALDTVRARWVGVARCSEEDFGPVMEGLRRLPRPPRPVGLDAGDRFTVGRFSVEVLWPPSEVQARLDANDVSVVLLVRRGRFEAVLAGDAEDAAQAGMRGGRVRDIDVLKVPHHGSENGLVEETARTWSPSLALVSVGEGNRFGHPSSATLALLRRNGAAVRRTDLEGDLEVVLDGDRMRLRTSRRSSRVTAVRQ